MFTLSEKMGLVKADPPTVRRNTLLTMRITRFRATAVRMTMVLLALLLASFSILTTSRAAFTDTTDNTGNDFAAGTVAISDDDSGSVLFDVGNFTPGDSFENCIVVQYDGSLDADVRFYGANLATTTALNLAPQLNLTVEEGTGSAFLATELGGNEGDCTGFVASSTLTAGGETLDSFATGYTDFATGLSAWAPLGSSSDTRTYRFVVELDAGAPNTFQGMDAQFDFIWEAQNS